MVVIEDVVLPENNSLANKTGKTKVEKIAETPRWLVCVQTWNQIRLSLTVESLATYL